MVYKRRTFGQKARKFVRKSVIGRAKKRYVNSKGQARFGKIAKDIMYIKNSLNVERKHLDLTWGTFLPVGYTSNLTMIPSVSTPVITPLDLPVRGTAYNQRVGNQLKLTNISYKAVITKLNSTTALASTTVQLFVVFVKDGGPFRIEELLEVDAEGNRTLASYYNQQNFKKFYIPGMLKYQRTFSDAYERPSTGNESKFYVSRFNKMNQRIMFEDSTETVATYKPFLVAMTDNTGAGDEIQINCQMRLSYVDN